MKTEDKKQMKRGRGRPAAGKVIDGDKPVLISKYPKMCVYLEPGVKAQLTAAAHIVGTPAWELVNMAIKQYIERMPRPDRAILEALAGRMRDNPKFQQ